MLFLSALNPKRLLQALIVLVIALIVGAGLFTTPANADSVGDINGPGVSGNVRVDGEPVAGVRMIVEGGGYSAETVTDENGQWFIGVPSKDPTYNVTIDESTLPEGVVVLEGEPTQQVTLDRGDRVVKNFFIGEGVRNVVSFGDQLIARLVYGLNFGLMLGLAAVGLSLVFGTTGLSNFAHSEMVTFGAVAALILGSTLQLPMWLAIPAAVVLSGGFGWALDAGLWKPLRKR